MRGVILLAGLLAEAQLLTLACTASGESWPWNRSIRSVCFSRTVHKNVFLSPDKAKRIEVEENKGFSLFVNGRRVAWPNYGKFIVLPVAFSWSPSSDAFFINDGQGSGEYSQLYVFQVDGVGVAEGRDFNKLVSVAFRKDVGCSTAAANPSMTGLGWSKDGAQIFAFAQATVHNPCGSQGDLRGVTLNVKAGSIEHFYSEAATVRTFRHLLPH